MQIIRQASLAFTARRCVGVITLSLVLGGLWLSSLVACAQGDTSTVRTDFRNQLYDTNAIGTSIPQAEGVSFFSGNIGAATNVLVSSTNIIRPNDGQGIYLLASAIGQPVGMMTVPFNLSVQGSGTNTPSPAPELWFQLYQQVSLNATPGRYHAFAGWSDGNGINPRPVVAGATNSYTATFTNAVPLFTTNIAGFNYVGELGMPLIFMNGQLYPHDVVVTNAGAQLSVTMSPTYTNGIIRYTLDGSDPITGTLYTGAFNVIAPFKIRAVGFTSLNANPRYADQVNSLNVTVPGGGSVAAAPQTDFFNGAASALLTATPDAGWTFLNWMGDSTSTNPVITLAVDQPKSVTAVFGTTVAPGVNDIARGYVTNLPVQALYAYGSVVRLAAVPLAGNSFASWGGAISGGVSPVDFTVTNANPTITANFANLTGNDRSLAVVTIGEGDVLKSPPANVYTNGANVTLTATPRAGQSFVSWSQSGGVIGTSTNLTVTMTNSKVIYATFAITQPFFAFSSASYSVNQADGSVAVTIQNLGVLGTNVNFSTLNGSAVGGNGSTGDYTSTNGTLIFASGPSSQTVHIPIRNQFLLANAKSFQVNLSGTAGTISSPSNTTVTISYSGVLTTNGSQLWQAFPGPVPDHSGSLRVTITPPLPSTSGGYWRFPWEIAWRGSGGLVTNLAPADYEIEFRTFGGYSIFPLNVEDGRVFTGATTEATNFYNQVGSVATGKLTVNLGPNTGNITANGGWRLLGETNWQSPGATLTNLSPADNYLIEFKPITGLVKPEIREVPVYASQQNVISAYYAATNSLPPGVTLPNPLPSLGLITGSVTNDPRLPFAFNGQLQTEAGFGSGVAVRARSVLTAAHLVFNDVNLSFVDVDKVYWFFQKQIGELEPKPLTARGWYMLSGYASARTNDLTVLTNLYSAGVSSPESRRSDVAVIYFLSPAARGGFGGYLASDAVTNEWLMSSQPKMLVGYPLDGTPFGYTNVVAGKMHATATNNYAFTQEGTNEVYLTQGFLSFPGNSGGPVYVLNTNGIYYPAGVYLGTVGSVSAVRAIDSSVVNLINLAEGAAQFDPGTNFTGGGVIRIVSSATSGSLGYLQVLIGPASALQAGGGWRIAGTTNVFQNSANFTATFTNQTAQIEFAEASGWESPPSRSVIIPRGLTVIEAGYVVSPPNMSFNSESGFGISGATNTHYRIEYRTNLVSGAWLPLQTNTISSGGFNFLLPWPPTNGLPSVFYRAVWLP